MTSVPSCQDEDKISLQVRAVSAASAARWLIMISAETKPFPRPRTRAPGHPQYASFSQAGRQLAAQRSPALNEEGLIDGFVADAHRLSSGKSIGRRRAIAPGSRPWPIADPFAGYARPCTERRDQERERRSGLLRRRQVSPPHKRAKLR